METTKNQQGRAEMTEQTKSREEAVEAARSFHWEGAPLKRNLIEEVLNAAEPHLRRGWENSLLGPDAVEAAARALLEFDGELELGKRTNEAESMLRAALEASGGTER